MPITDPWTRARLDSTAAAVAEGRISAEVGAIRAAQIRGEITDEDADARVVALANPAPAP